MQCAIRFLSKFAQSWTSYHSLSDYYPRDNPPCAARVFYSEKSYDREREREKINLENAKVRAMRVFLRQLSVGFLAGLFRTVRGYARREQEKREKKADHREVRGKKYVGGAISSLEDEETSNKL